MSDKTHNLNAFDGNKQRGKDKEKKRFKGQIKRVYNAFSKEPKTMLQASMETNIMRANICRYIGKWRKYDKIGVAKYGRCPISKNKGVGFYTTNRDLFIKPKNKK